MAGNQELIDEVVDPIVKTQVSDLQSQLEALNKQLIDTAKNAISVNNVVGNSKSFPELNKNTQAAAISQQKLQQELNKTAQTAVNLEKAQNTLSAQTEKAAQAAQKALSPYQQLNKKLDELRATAKNVGATFGENSEQFKKAATPVQELDAKLKAIRQTLGQSQGPYNQLSKQLDNLRQKAKDVGAQFGIHSQQFKDASKPVQELDKKLKDIDQTLGQSQRNVGNYGKAFAEAFTEYIPFLGGTIKVRENVKELGEAVGVSEEKLGSLGGAFANFAIGGFAVAIGLAINYLTQFQGYADKIDIFFAGLKGRANELGKDVVDAVAPDPGKESAISKFIQKYKDALAGTPIGGLLKKIFVDSTDDAAAAAEAVEKLNKALENNENITETLNARDQADANNKRTTADDKLLEYQKRKQLLDEAEALEQRALDRTKEDSKERIDVAVKQANVLGVLSDKEIQRLKDGDIKLATELFRSTDPNKLISKDAYKNLLEGYQKQTQAEEMQTQNILKIRNDRANLEVRDERELTKALEELDASRIQGEQLREKLILENDDKNYDTKLKALDDYVKNSKKLAQIKLADDLAAAQVPGRAGLDPKIIAIKEAKARQDYQNEIVKIDSEGLKQRQDLNKKEVDSQKKNLQELLAANKGLETETINALEVGVGSRLQLIEDAFDKEVSLINKKYAKGELDQKQAQDALLKLDDQYNIDRLGQEVFLQQSILEIKQAALDNDLALAQNRGAKPDELRDITNKSGVPQQENAVNKAGSALNKALGKGDKDDTQIGLDAKKKAANDFGVAVQDLQQVQNEASKLEQAHIEAEIALLEKKKQAIDEQASAEKDAVNGSILSAADKQRKINIIDAQAAQQKKQIDQQIADAKRKQAIFDKAASIANIIENTAVAIVKTLAEGGAIFGIPLVPVIAALGAIQLAAAVATPLPKFEKGGKTKGGAFIWGEKGPEMAIEPGGRSYLSPDGPSIGIAPAGTQIIPNHMLRPEKLNYTAGQQVPWERILTAIHKNKPEPQKRPIVRVNVNNDSYYQKFYR